MQVRFQVANPIGDFVYQTITNATHPVAVVPGEAYIFSAFVMATGTLNPNTKVILQTHEWLFDDPITPAATHTILAERSLFNRVPGQWQRIRLSFTATTSADLGSFTLELGITGANPGEAVLFDGIQLEKAFHLPNAPPTDKPTNWVPDKGLVSPSEKPDIRQGESYFTW
jgi:hypothetical protein